MARTGARKYNQGLCSRKPCRTHEGVCSRPQEHCCYEVGQTAAVEFTCSDSHSPERGHVIITCTCQPCSQLKVEVTGEVVSSHGNKPLVLATVSAGGEVVTFTNQQGTFSFETISPSSMLALTFHEARHRELERNLTVLHSLRHRIKVILEHIEIIDSQEKMEAGFDSLLVSSDVIENYGVNGFLHFPPDAFISSETDEPYRGSGSVLTTLYCTDKWPLFSTEALSNLVYVDSRGAEFSIQSLVIGTLDVVGEGGEHLELAVGAPVVATVSLRLDSNVSPAQASSLHLFSYSHLQSRWLDHGRMTVVRDTSSEEDRGTHYWATLQGKLRQLHRFWAVGYPLRLSCWVKVLMFQGSGLREEVSGIEIQLRQSDNDMLGKGSFYQHSMSTLPGVGACLKSVCSLGGVLSPSRVSGTELEAVTPSISNGIIMGNKYEIMIYTVDKLNIGISGKHPFYPSEEACRQHSGVHSGHFMFVVKSKRWSPYQTKPTILLTEPSERQENHVEGFCYLKVAVLDCAVYSDVKAVSYSAGGEISSVAFEIVSTLSENRAPLKNNKDSCIGASGVTRLKASCVDFTCGSRVHVSAQSRMERRHTKPCRYWSSTSSIQWSIPPSHNHTSFHFTDEGAEYGQGQGIYYALTKELALMKCYSGSHNEPSNTLDPYKGAAVTFTCL